MTFEEFNNKNNSLAVTVKKVDNGIELLSKDGRTVVVDNTTFVNNVIGKYYITNPSVVKQLGVFNKNRGNSRGTKNKTITLFDLYKQWIKLFDNNNCIISFKLNNRKIKRYELQITYGYDLQVNIEEDLRCRVKSYYVDTRTYTLTQEVIDKAYQYLLSDNCKPQVFMQIMLTGSNIQGIDQIQD